MPKEDVKPLSTQEAFYRWMDIWNPVMVRFQNFTWQGEDRDQFWHFLRRGAVVRQFESLRAIRKLMEAGQGNFGVVFLRTSFEELVWIEYLHQHPGVANDLILALANLEIAANVKAQNEYAGRAEMARGGFPPPIVRAISAADPETREKIRSIGKILGWNMSRSLLPSMSYVAQRVEREKDYKFLYQGTSRYVHFSTQEILRRVWGVKGKVRISSEHFSGYWEQFAISWGVRIFADLIIACVDDFGEYADEVDIGEVGRLQNLFVGRIPIVTSEELVGWS